MTRKLARIREKKPRLAIDFNDEYLSLYTGNSVTTFKEYENISIKIYGKTSPKDGVRGVAATVSWKKERAGRWQRLIERDEPGTEEPGGRVAAP